MKPKLELILNKQDIEQILKDFEDGKCSVKYVINLENDTKVALKLTPIGFEKNRFHIINNTIGESVIYLDNIELEIYGKPNEVFCYLMNNRERIISSQELLEKLWDEPELVSPNVIEQSISVIRKKIDKKYIVTTIETIRRKGYRFIFKSEIE